ELDLSENEIGETGARALGASPHLGKLRSLELRDNRLGPAGAEALAGSERLASLHRLGVGKNEVGAPRLHSLARADALLRVRALANSPHLNRVLTLDLSNNPFSDSGCRAFLQSAHWRSLRHPLWPYGLTWATRQALDSHFNRPRRA